MQDQKFKALMKETSDVHCEMGLHTLKFPLLHHAVGDLHRFRSLGLLNSSAFKQYNVHIK